jgi:hypothetical protein
VGSLAYTSKGINLWWIKVDDKHNNPAKKCKCCSRRHQKYYSVYEKDPFAPENSFIGNVVLEDSTKATEEQFSRCVFKRSDPEIVPRFHE